MKESEPQNSPQNINNNEIIVNNIYNHNIKESAISFNIEKKSPDVVPENGNSTMMSTKVFLKEEECKDNPLTNLNKSLPEKDTSNHNLKVNCKDNSTSPTILNESFYQKIKRWAWTFWSYINIKNYFPKIEYKEYRNINGDMVKIPIKKLPLKNKPKVELNEEEQIVNKLVERNNSEIKYYAAHSVPYYNQFI